MSACSNVLRQLVKSSARTRARIDERERARRSAVAARLLLDQLTSRH
jgi:hypothetical protein